LLLREYPDVMMIVGGSNARQSAVENGGSKPEPVLRWNTEWQQTALAYLAEDPLFRKHRHASVRACAEAGGVPPTILPLSHDAFWGENQSLLGRVVGDYEQKFSTIRTFMTYTMTHPGKKLTFMGCEIGQFCKWDSDKEVEWQLLEYEMHAKLQLFIAELNHLYLKSSTLWEGDGAADSFSWIDGDDAARSLFSYCRRDAEGRELTVLLNFTPVEHNGYCLPVSRAGAYKECLNSDAVRYGGRDRVNAGVLVAEASDGKETPVLHIRLAPMSAIVLQCVGPDER
jgi:1,4-alpha-glucan branching enzyme